MASHLFSNEKLVQAFIANDFNISAAARALGMTPQNFYHLRNTRPELAEALLKASEEMLDIAESTLFKHIRDGNLDATKYFLDRRGGGRGYNPKSNINVNIDNSDEILQCIELKTKTYDKVVNDGSTDGL
jgi:DNA replicative helicase MCM subunit Mcm2 (Cdc46/Mcm family)|tara:strand:- start:3499 stop:3888 length:390 start_codon:yes stop_codon:yes gene_type:complete